MATKKQHFVPRVYIKAWETTVENSKEPNKKFQGVYVFSKEDAIGDGKTKESILWKPHLYTIKFNQLYMAKYCPKVFNFYVNAVYDAMANNQPAPVYGKFGRSIICTKDSIRKHLMDIEQWDFYYENDDEAKKKAILNRINDIRCYLLEESFDSCYEARWEQIRDVFIKEVTNNLPTSIGGDEKYISEKSANDMLEFFFMMLCRNPSFSAMGIYYWINDLLRSAYGDIEEVDKMMDALWFSELYRMIYKNTGGFYHNIINMALKSCKFVLFEARNEAEFITSDSPAFQNNCRVLSVNKNGYIFPLTPKYMLFIGKGEDDIRLVAHQYANEKTVKNFNRLIRSNCDSIIIGTKKQLYNLL